MADEQPIYRVTFLNQGQIYELYAEHVSQGGLFGFIEVEGLLFGERSQLVVDPGEERLKKEFEGVRRIHVPLHAVVRIDEVTRQGTSRIVEREGSDNVASFPMTLYRPDPTPKG